MLPRARFTIGRFMVVTVAVALVLTAVVGFLRSPPGERRALLILMPLSAVLLALVGGPLVVAGALAYRQAGARRRRGRRTPPRADGIRFLDEA